MRLTDVHVHHVKNLDDLGLMGPDTTYIHCTDSTDEELDLIAKTGGPAPGGPLFQKLIGDREPPTRPRVGRGARRALGIAPRLLRPPGEGPHSPPDACPQRH